MTPEERAKQVCAELKGAPYDPEEWIEAQSPDVLEAVTSAIRAAENDALERAAVRLDQMAISSAAAAVRALKHKIT